MPPSADTVCVGFCYYLRVLRVAVHDHQPLLRHSRVRHHHGGCPGLLSVQHLLQQYQNMRRYGGLHCPIICERCPFVGGWRWLTALASRIKCIYIHTWRSTIPTGLLVCKGCVCCAHGGFFIDHKSPRCRPSQENRGFKFRCGHPVQ